MGLVLRRCSKYSFPMGPTTYEFIKDVPVFNLPADVEKILLLTGNFHFVAKENEPVPREIRKTDENYKAREEGLIDREGRPVDPETGRSLSEVEQKLKNKQAITELFLDENDNVVRVDKDASGKVLGTSDVEDLGSPNLPKTPAVKKENTSRKISRTRRLVKR